MKPHKKLRPDEKKALENPERSLYGILPSDRRFTDSPEPGPDCWCSRCDQPIIKGLVFRFWPRERNGSIVYEYRYHPACVGVQVLLEDDEEEE